MTKPPYSSYFMTDARLVLLEIIVTISLDFHNDLASKNRDIATTNKSNFKIAKFYEETVDQASM